MAFMITHLTSQAHDWARAKWERCSAICRSEAAFSEALGLVFGHPISGWEVARALGQIQQGNSRVFDHGIRFLTLAAQSQWNDDAFWHNFSEAIKDRLTTIDLPSNFEGLAEFAIKVDNHLHECE